MNKEFRTTRGEYSSEKGRYRDTNNVDSWSSSYSSAMLGEERGYVLGVEDERRRYHDRMQKIIINLKARVYSLMDIAEDTGFSLEEISVL